MTQIDIDETHGAVAMARNRARRTGHVQRAQMMLLVAGLAAFGIVAVAATMMMTLL